MSTNMTPERRRAEREARRQGVPAAPVTTPASEAQRAARRKENARYKVARDAGFPEHRNRR